MGGVGFLPGVSTQGIVRASTTIITRGSHGEEINKIPVTFANFYGYPIDTPRQDLRLKLMSDAAKLIEKGTRPPGFFGWFDNKMPNPPNVIWMGNVGDFCSEDPDCKSDGRTKAEHEDSDCEGKWKGGYSEGCVDAEDGVQESQRSQCPCRII